MIRNGKKMDCNGQCKNLKLNIQDFTIFATFYVLPIQGVDIVLGVQEWQNNEAYMGPKFYSTSFPSATS